MNSNNSANLIKINREIEQKKSKKQINSHHKQHQKPTEWLIPNQSTTTDRTKQNEPMNATEQSKSSKNSNKLKQKSTEQTNRGTMRRE